MKDIEILKNLALFKGLDDNELIEIKEFLSSVKTYKSKEIIFNTGDPINYFGILSRGQVDLSIEDVFGNKTLLSKLRGPALFAESVLIRDVGEIPLSVVAVDDSEVIFFDYKAYKSSGSSSLIKVQDNLIRILAGKNLFMRDKLNLLSLPSTRAKILYFLSNEARKRKSKYFEIDFNISELAQFLNLNRSSLSRELSKLKKEGLIDYDNKTFRIL